jgi:site-specific DNA recombinase
MTLAIGMRRIVWYARVSSDDQRDRATIQTQIEELERAVARTPGVVVVERYIDDGVSGMIPIAARPAGGRLVRDRLAGRFTEVWVYDIDRLGRDAPDIMRARRDLEVLGIPIFTPAGEVPPLLFDFQAVIGDYARVQFLKRSADGMARAAREGRYTGGIVPLGYRVDGMKQNARLVADDTALWADRSAADIVRQIYARLGVDGWSCRQIADELNALGVPTHYARDGRGIRGRRTRGLWRAGRIRNMVINPTYRGDLRYGRRTNRAGREVIEARIEPLVSGELWVAAQAALARNRVCTKNTRRIYLLKGVMRCSLCGLTYVGSYSQRSGWYRCGGQLVERGPEPGRCRGHSVRADAIEPVVWADVERFLRAPGEVLDELDGRTEREAQAAIAEADGIMLRRVLDGLDDQRGRALALNIRGRLADAELDAELDRIAAERTDVEGRLAALEAPQGAAVPEVASDLLDQVRARLDAGLTDEQRQEIVRLLVAIRIDTSVPPDGGKKTVRAVVTYRFPAVVETRTGIRAGLNYTVRRRVIELPAGRRRRVAA